MSEPYRTVDCERMLPAFGLNRPPCSPRTGWTSPGCTVLTSMHVQGVGGRWLQAVQCCQQTTARRPEHPWKSVCELQEANYRAGALLVPAASHRGRGG